MSIFIIKRAAMMKESHQPPKLLLRTLYAILGTHCKLKRKFRDPEFILSRYQVILVLGF